MLICHNLKVLACKKWQYRCNRGRQCRHHGDHSTVTFFFVKKTDDLKLFNTTNLSVKIKTSLNWDIQIWSLNLSTFWGNSFPTFFDKFITPVNICENQSKFDASLILCFFLSILPFLTHYWCQKPMNFWALILLSKL